MVRTQIQLTDEQARLVKQIAAERQVSMAAVIREVLDDSLRSHANVPSPADRARVAIQAVGRFRSGTGDGATAHDKHLATAYQE